MRKKMEHTERNVNPVDLKLKRIEQEIQNQFDYDYKRVMQQMKDKLGNIIMIQKAKEFYNNNINEIGMNSKNEIIRKIKINNNKSLHNDNIINNNNSNINKYKIIKKINKNNKIINLKNDIKFNSIT